jgi:U32 family peptidase
MIKPNILAPVGNFISLKTAINAGCDEIYFGIKGFNMRAGAQNFLLKDIIKIVKLCHDNKVKAFLALNTIIYENELKKLDLILRSAKKAGVDAIIAWDMAVVEKANLWGFDIHLSTQSSISNYESLKSYKKKIKNLKRVVLARECSLVDIKKIALKIKKDKLDVGLEIFVHGAMCVSVSGRCFMSQEVFNKSANRGECLQPCRRKYLVKDCEENNEFIIGEDYVMSPNDLCTMPFIEKLIDSGVESFKIEGRNRNPEYVSTVVSCYKTIVDYYMQYKFKIKRNNIEKKDFNDLKKQLVNRLKSVYYRGFSSGFFMGKPIREWSKIYGSKSKEYKQYVGKVINYYTKISVCEVKVESYPVKVGDNIIFMGPTTGLERQTIEEIHNISGKIIKAKKGDLITIKTNKKIRKNDLLYKVVFRKGD